ncbi:MAG: hypothetical protein L7S48_00760, partial [Candidatus Poseidonia sp.]|nr:hypothetical protein [Poseidonia sp.]
MVKSKTSAEIAREEAENAQLDNMLGGAFGGIEVLEKPAADIEEAQKAVEESTTPPEPVAEEVTEDAASPPPSSPPTGPPSGPPSGPPTGPPSGPPSGPPTGPPSGPPSGPPETKPSAEVAEEPPADDDVTSVDEAPSVLDEPQEAVAEAV